VLVDKLKSLLNQFKEQYINLYDEKMDVLQKDEYFSKVNPDQKRSILLKRQLLEKPIIKDLDASGLLNHLQKSSFAYWRSKVTALPAEFQSAREDAIALLAPQATTFSLPKVTISNQTDIDNYISELKTELEELLKTSSSIILK
jgi:hypothetical protein